MQAISFLGAFGEFLAGAQLQFIYWTLALAGTIIFAVFMALNFMGFGALHDAEPGADGMIPDHPDVGYADFKLISVRSVLAFITFFGWGGVVFGRLGWFGLFAAIACGASMMFLTALLIMFVYRLQHSGNLKGSDFVGKRGTVYFGIPAGRAGNGKITVTAGGSTSELLAVADEELPTGSTIEVVEQLDDRKFLVRKA